MVILGVLVGLTYGVLLAEQKRFPWAVRILLMTMGLATLVLAAGRISQDSDTAAPWIAGCLAFSLATLVANLRLGRRLRQSRQLAAH